jgi:hypothetical protein
MGKTIVLNSTNIVPDGTNSRFQYNFPNGGYVFKNDLIAVEQIAQYNSVFNITQALNNNVFYYNWINNVQYTVTIPDGAYSIPTLNSYFQSVMIKNGTYYTLGNNASTTSQTNVYLMEFVLNPSQYAVQLNCYFTYASYATSQDWVIPTFTGTQTVWVNPTKPIIPYITTTSNNFYKLIGFAPSTKYPNAVIFTTGGFAPPNQQETIDGTTLTTANVTNYSALSITSPNVSPSSSFLVYCSLVNNRSVIPSSLIYTYSPTGVVIGALGVYEPKADLCWNKVLDGTYNSFIVEFRNQLGEVVTFKDPNTLITLQTKNRDEFAEYNN